MISRLALTLAAIVLPTFLFAGPVKLTTHDGNVVVEGELLSFKGDFYRIQTEAGALSVDATMVVCSGDTCPDPEQLIARATISAEAPFKERLLVPLIQAYAKQSGYSIKGSGADAKDEWHFSLSGGPVVAILSVVDRGNNADLLVGRSVEKGAVRREVLALDALVPVVAPDNERAMVTMAQLQALLSNDIENWTRLAGPDLPVSLHLPEGATALLERIQPLSRYAEGQSYGEPSQLAAAVSNDPTALGLVHYSSIGNTIPLIISGPCGLAIPATRDTIRAEDYPLTEPVLFQQLNRDLPRLFREFIDFSLGPEAQNTVRRTGYVDQAIGRIAFERQGDRLANAVLNAGVDEAAIRSVQNTIGALMRGERLTLTFRFEDATNELDLLSTSNVQRLADAIWNGDFDERELLFSGFVDEGRREDSLEASLRMAQYVRDKVAQQVAGSDTNLVAEGFGDVMPLSCKGMSWSRNINKRVEVWVR